MKSTAASVPSPRPVSLVWFRQDLRLADHPALAAAVARGTVVPVFAWDPTEEGDWPAGGASRWWWHASLTALAAGLAESGSRLIVRRGPAGRLLAELAAETGATAVFWNRRYEPAAIARDTAVKDHLKTLGLHAESFNGALLYEPWTIRNQAEKPFQVFTPFWRHCLAQPEPPPPLPAPKGLNPPKTWPKSEPLESLHLRPTRPWDAGFRPEWQPGEVGAAAALESFRTTGWPTYTADRNRPDLRGTSRLSPHLHFGEITPRQVLARLAQHAAAAGEPDWRQRQYVTEIGWREFAHHLLYHFPRTPTEPLRAEFARFPWRDDEAQMRAWQRGRTGYPIVDAGMRELWATGWMHNRVRMIVASFLVKDLRLPWQAGSRWFWDTLVDADLAQNTLGWQWSAGCGADAAPYFRIFNPVNQGEKFDPDGAYVRRWVPELAGLDAEFLHAPWLAPATELTRAGIEYGRTYPQPMVDHSEMRTAALAAFQELRAERGSADAGVPMSVAKKRTSAPRGGPGSRGATKG